VLSPPCPNDAQTQVTPRPLGPADWAQLNVTASPGTVVTNVPAGACSQLRAAYPDTSGDPIYPEEWALYQPQTVVLDVMVWMTQGACLLFRCVCWSWLSMLKLPSLGCCLAAGAVSC
jgi:hypothetical protein